MTMTNRTVAIAALAALAISPVSAAAQEAVFGAPAPKVSYGEYVRIEGGISQFRDVTGDWKPPNFPTDPHVFFDVDGDRPAFASLGLGFDYANGRRGEISITGFGSQSVDAPWSRTVPAVPGPHADVSAKFSTTAILANMYFSPAPGTFGGPRFQPFLTAGAGLAINDVGDWTRRNPAATRPVRRFEGKVSSDFAWSIGAGASYDISAQGKRPVFLDVSYRYFDLGTASGSRVPLPGNGSSRPVKPFTFDNTNHAVSVGIRIPLRNN